MNWKEFFKPTWEKSIWWGFLFLILPIIVEVSVFGGPAECNGADRCITGYVHTFFSLGGIYTIAYISHAGSVGNALSIISNSIVGITALIIYSYLISCLLVFLSNHKFKGKNS